MKFGILTTTWGRPALTRQVLGYYSNLELPDIAFEYVAVRSPEDPHPHEPVPGWRYLDFPNQPRGRKGNAGMEVMRLLDVDAVMLVGSDDLVSRTYLEVVIELISKKNVSTTFAKDLYVYVPPSDEVMYLHSVSPGAGRVLRRDALDALNWKPWQSDIDIQLDASVISRIKQADINRNTLRNMAERDFAVLDVKLADGPQLWRVVRTEGDKHVLRSRNGHEMKLRSVTYFPASYFFAEHFPEIENYQQLGTDG